LNKALIPVSIGIAHNVLLAKLATRAAKPAGVYHLVPALAPDFLVDLDVKDLPSIGYSTANKIEEKFGTTKCGPLLEITKSALQKTLGPKTGEMVFGYLRGVDDKKLEPHKERKSISAEMNVSCPLWFETFLADDSQYGIRFRNQEQAEICIRDLGAEVAKRLAQINVKGRLLTLKLMSRHPDAPIEPPKVSPVIISTTLAKYNSLMPVPRTRVVRNLQ
jgi:DNA repair protein REV1